MVRHGEKLKVCYFGSYDPMYTRVRVVVKGLRDNCAKVVECCSRHQNILVRFPILVYKFLKDARDVDVILVNEAGQANTPLAKLIGLSTRKPVILDAYVSKYLVSVVESGLVPKGSFRAKLLHHMDSIACRLADKVLLDTDDHVDYFCQEFGLAKSKFESVLIGADDEWFKPTPRQNLPEQQKLFRVLYVGTFNPLQGNEDVIRAAWLLRDYPDIRFDFYGDGPKRAQLEALAEFNGVANVVFHGWTSPKTVPNLMANADICLGVFGQTTQAELVIPCKVFEALAMGRPILTGDTRAVRRFLRHKEHVYLCPPGDPKRIADGVLELRNDLVLRRRIGDNGLRLFRETASRSRVGARVKKICETLVTAKRGKASAA